MRIDFPYLMVDWDRHGNQRVYVRRHGRKVRIKAKPGSEAFAQAYADALHAIEHGDGEGRQIIKGAAVGTWAGWRRAIFSHPSSRPSTSSRRSPAA
jgi:hypothetical protein